MFRAIVTAVAQWLGARPQRRETNRPTRDRAHIALIANLCAAR